MNTQSNTVQAFWVGVSSLSSILLSLISAAILSRWFDKVEYGTYKQIAYVYATLSLIFSGGLPSVFAYFLPHYSREEGKSIVKKINLLLLVFGFLFSISLFFFSEVIAVALNNPELSRGLMYFSPIPLFLLPTLGLEGILSTYRKTQFLAIYNSISRLIILGFIVAPVILFDGDYTSAILGWLTASILVFIIALYFKNLPFRDVIQKKDSLSLARILSYSLPLVMASLAGLMYRSANQFFISRKFGASVFAEFSNGFIEIPFVGMITGAAATVLMPLFSRQLRGQELSLSVIELWRSAIIKSAKLIYPIVVFCFVMAPEIILFVFGDSYLVSTNYFRLNIIINLFNVLVFAPLILSLGKSFEYGIIHLILAIILWGGSSYLYYTVTSPFYFVGLFVALEICKIFIFLFIICRILQVKMEKIFPLRQFLIILGFSILCMVPGFIVNLYFLSDQQVFARLLISSLLFSISFLSLNQIFNLGYKKILYPLYSNFLSTKK